MNTEQHLRYFAEFCLWELASGGPDPQIKMVGEMSKGLEWKERVWRAGCYISVYNVPFAEVIWQQWSYKDVIQMKPEFRTWLHANWGKIVTRVERKTVRRPEWMFEYFSSYIDYMGMPIMNDIRSTNGLTPETRYVHFWDSTIKHIKRYGRYVALKLLESYSQFCSIHMVAPDIRPKDGWSPRITLSVLYPKYATLLNGNDNKDNETVNDIVNDLQKVLRTKFSIMIDLFQLQVMLCEYRESYHSQKQYPGRSLDSELGYYQKAKTLWGDQYVIASDLLKARQNLFPQEHLGELHGWNGTRKDCGKVLATYGYTWSDLKYNYLKSMYDMGHPVEWSKPLPKLKRYS